MCVCVHNPLGTWSNCVTKEKKSLLLPSIAKVYPTNQLQL